MTKNKKYLLIALLYLSFFTHSFAQFYRSKNFGLTVGASIAVGNKFQRIGINCNAYYFYNFIQINAGIQAYHNIKNLGPIVEYNEAVMSGGLVLAYGPKQTLYNPFLSVYSNQTKHIYSIAYSYNAYFNTIKTSQQTGIVALQFNHVSVVIENDILAKPILDRFRTGAFLVQYQYKNLYQAALNCTLWTGQMGKQVNNSAFKSSCYMDTTNGVYPAISHGLLSAQVKVSLGYGQVAQANLGVDAEKVRNLVQNRWIHDMPGIPKKWIKHPNCHIPMIDKEGKQYIPNSGQSIRKPSVYWNVFSNPSAFY